MIDPDRWYTIKDLHKVQLEYRIFPWLRGDSYPSFWGFIKKELAGKNLLKIKELSGVTKNRFLIKGEHVISYLNDRLK